MSGLPGAFLTKATLDLIEDPLAKTVATVRRFCDRKGVCHQKTQRYLAEQAGLPLGVFNRALHRAAALGIWDVLPRQHCRERTTISFRPEHLWVTPEKQPATPPHCSTRWNTKSKATQQEKRTPEAPADAGESAQAFLQSVEKGCGPVEAVSEPKHRHLEPGEQCRHCGHKSTRRTPYGQPRKPRRPRPSRQRQRKKTLADAMAAILAQDDAAAAGPAAGPALPRHDIIPPGYEFVAGEVIPKPRQAAPRPRGYAPATGILEAMNHVLGISETPDRAVGDDPARPLLATGRGPAGPTIDLQRVA